MIAAAWGEDSEGLTTAVHPAAMAPTRGLRVSWMGRLYALLPSVSPYIMAMGQHTQ